eukprot:1026021-Pelagomonas_calceolata.AAC.5
MCCSRVMEQKPSNRCPCIPALPGTHNWLASSQTALLCSPCNDTLYVVTVLEVWITLLHVCLYAPPCPHLYTHVALALSYAHRPLLYPICMVPIGRA